MKLFTSFLTLGFALSAFAQSPSPRKVVAQARARTKSRQVANVESPSKYQQLRVAEEAPAQRRSELSGTVGLSAGMGTGGGSSALVIGLQADVHWGRFLGAELDGFFVPSGTSTQTGILANIEGRYAFRAGDSAILTPKIGVGFGFMGTSVDTGAALIPGGVSATTTGMYGVAGLEARLYRRFTLTGDFALSLLASGSSSFSGSAATAITDVGFDRLRIGAHYRVSVPLSVGVQFVRRGSSASGTSGAQNHFTLQGLLHW